MPKREFAVSALVGFVAPERGCLGVARGHLSRSDFHRREVQSDRTRDIDELLLSTADGDRQSFSTLYRRTSSSLNAVVMRRIWRSAEAEEVLQETYVKVWRNAGAFNPRLSSASTWLGAVATNAAIDHLRRRSHQPASVPDEGCVEDGDEPLSERTASGSEWQPCHRVELKDRDARIDELMRSLSPSQRQVLQLAFRHGMSHSEIASHMGVPLGTVKSWARRAVEAIRSSGRGL